MYHVLQYCIYLNPSFLFYEKFDFLFISLINILKMSSRLFIFIVNIFIITLIFSPTFTSDALQDIGELYCSDGTNTNLYCCPIMAHRINPSSSKSINLINKSGSMNLKFVSLKRGQWVKGHDFKCELQTNSLENGYSEVFSSVPNSNYDNCMYGIATFTINDDISRTLIITWGNFSVNHYILSKNKYNVENVKVQMTVTSTNEEGFSVTYQQLTVYNNTRNSWLLILVLVVYIYCFYLLVAHYKIRF